MFKFKVKKLFSFFSSSPARPSSPRKRNTSTMDERQEAEADLIRLFPTMACGKIQEMKQTLVDARNLYEPEKTKKVCSILIELNQLKKQSILFGYPLVCDVATHLEKIIRNSSSFSEAKFTVMHNDILLLQRILWKKISGDGGERGRKILNQLSRIPK